MKPERWQDCPSVVLEKILCDYIDLEYDRYESSKAACIHDILCSLEGGPIAIWGYSTNMHRLDAYWKALTKEKFEQLVSEAIAEHQKIAYRLESYLG